MTRTRWLLLYTAALLATFAAYSVGHYQGYEVGLHEDQLVSYRAGISYGVCVALAPEGEGMRCP